jgi:hypothetical protein
MIVIAIRKLPIFVVGVMRTASFRRPTMLGFEGIAGIKRLSLVRKQGEFDSTVDS